MKHWSVAVDGPSGAGKSTIAQALAKELGFIHVDTGAIYRAVGLYMLEQGIGTQDEAAVSRALPGVGIEIRHEGGAQRILLNGKDVSEAIRRPEVSKAASDVSAMPPVRTYLLDMQRALAKNNNVIMDGRDIGTVVLPDADVKIFLSASSEERARRRFEELLAKGDTSVYEQVLNDMQRRDANDSTREASPLRMADDAVAVDTTGNTLEQSILAIGEIIRSKTGHAL